MRVVFTGSRKFTNYDQVRERMRELVEEYGDALEIAHGASKGGGVDAFVAQAAAEFGVTEWPYPVRSGKTGIDGNHRGAPLNRNTRMLKSFMGDKLIAFRSPGKSNGTDDCIEKAEKFGYEVEINEENT